MDRWPMIAECPMTEDCPGYDRDRRVCLLRPSDCEFAPDADAAPVADAVADAVAGAAPVAGKPGEPDARLAAAEVAAASG